MTNQFLAEHNLIWARPAPPFSSFIQTAWEAGLTDEEWEEMEKHPRIGAEIVGEVPRLQCAARIIAQHQEKYDGTGYPEGLEGEEILLETRIIAVVDAWDAMRTDRPYRYAIPREAAIRELNKRE